MATGRKTGPRSLASSALLALALAAPVQALAGYTCTDTDGAGCPRPGATCYVDCDETSVRIVLATVNGCPPNTSADVITIAMGPDAVTTCGATPVPMLMAPTWPATAPGSCGDNDMNEYNALCLVNSGVVFDGRGATFTYAGDQICASCDGECTLCPDGPCASRQPALFVLRGNRNTLRNFALQFFPEGLHVRAGENHTIENVTAPYVCEDAITIDSTSGAGHRLLSSTILGNTKAATGGGSCWTRKEGSACSGDVDCAAFGPATRCYCGQLSQLGHCASPPPPPLWPSGIPGQCFAAAPCGLDKAVQVNGGESVIDGNVIHAFGQPVHVITGTHTIANNLTCGDHANPNVCQAYDVSGGSVTLVGNRIDHCKFGIRVVDGGQADADGNVLTNNYVSAFQVKGVGAARLRGENNLLRNNGYAAGSECQMGAIVVRDNPMAALDFGGGDFGGAAVFGDAVSPGGNVSCQGGPGHLNHLWNVTDCPCALDASCSCTLNSALGGSCGRQCPLSGPCCTWDTDGACYGSAGAGASVGMGAAGGAANWFDPVPVLVSAVNPNVVDRAPVQTRVENANPYDACGTIVVPECECFGLLDGTACTDGNACTQSDTCQNGRCTGGNPIVCTAQDQCHDVGTCDPATGACSNPTKSDGTACNDGNACTQTDTCQAGACVGANPVVCAARDQCHVAGICDLATGACSNPPITCDDGDPCTADTCDPAAGCVFNPVTGLDAATCLLTPEASCQPVPPAVAKWIARAQRWIGRARETGDPRAERPCLARASRAVREAEKKTILLANQRRLSLGCAQTLGQTLFAARSRIEQLRRSP